MDDASGIFGSTGIRDDDEDIDQLVYFFVVCQQIERTVNCR
jgi:hypothetical protein